MQSEAAALLDVGPNELRAFEEIDPFNGVLVKGYISLRRDQRMGALVIWYADGPTDPQVVWATPKFAYPFERDGVFHFPPTERVEVYEKLDGTNVLGFRYFARGRIFVSYKTRMMPFVSGSFIPMWRLMLERYPAIPALVLAGNRNPSFEMFGSLNRHLMAYDVPLDIRHIFSVDGVGVYPPPDVGAIPPVSHVATLTQPRALLGFYRAHQAELGAALVETEDGYEGSEGYMWYVLGVGGLWHPFKCKPEVIEAIHFASGGITNNVITHACYRVLEDGQELTLGTISEQLSQDWPTEAVTIAEERIKQVIGTVTEREGFRRRVVEEYERLRANGLSLLADRGATMRAMSLLFPRSQMQQVYTLIAAVEAASGE